MKVHELVRLLEQQCDACAEVYLLTDDANPFECDLAGLVIRELIEEPDDEADEPFGRFWGRAGEGDQKEGRDVLLLTGEQRSYSRVSRSAAEDGRLW